MAAGILFAALTRRSTSDAPWVSPWYARLDRLFCLPAQGVLSTVARLQAGAVRGLIQSHQGTNAVTWALSSCPLNVLLARGKVLIIRKLALRLVMTPE